MIAAAGMTAHSKRSFLAAREKGNWQEGRTRSSTSMLLDNRYIGRVEFGRKLGLA